MSASSEKRDSVTFIDTQRRYTPGREQRFVFTRCPELVPAARDWVGLFRVGWLSSRDYYTFEWVPTPSRERLTEAVTFAGKRLPPEDGYFYQVCYVSRDGTVRGASAPFQFCQPATSIGPVDDLELVEVQEEGMSLMVLQHKSKEDVQQLRHDCAQQREELESVQASFAALRVEKETLAGERESLEGKLAEMGARVGELEGVLRQREARVRELSTQLGQRTAAHGAELEEKQKLISELENQLQAAHENVQREQDAVRELMAVKVSEEGQIQLLQRKLEENQVRLVAYQGETSDLVQELKVKEAQIGDLKHLAKSHTEEIEQLTEKLDGCMCAVEEERVKVENLQSEKMIEGDQLREEVAIRQATIVELRQENDAFLQQIQDAEDQPPVGRGSGRVVDKSIYEALRQAYDNMEDYYRKSETENEALRRKLKESQDIARTLQGRCDELLTRIELCRQEFEAKALELEQLKQRRPADLSGEVAELQARVREMEETEEQLTQACGDAVRELTTRKEEGKQQETRISELQSMLEQVQASFDQLEERHDTRIQEKNEALDRQQQVLDSKVAELVELKEMNAQLEVTDQDLKKQVADLEEEKWQLSDQLRETAAERDGLKAKLQQYKAHMLQLQEVGKGEPQRTCPVCNTKFPGRMTQEEYERHVYGHFGD